MRLAASPLGSGLSAGRGGSCVNWSAQSSLLSLAPCFLSTLRELPLCPPLAAARTTIGAGRSAWINQIKKDAQLPGFAAVVSSFRAEVTHVKSITLGRWWAEMVGAHNHSTKGAYEVLRLTKQR